MPTITGINDLATNCIPITLTATSPVVHHLSLGKSVIDVIINFWIRICFGKLNCLQGKYKLGWLILGL